MTSLQSEGFSNLVRATAAKAREHTRAADAIRTALTLNGRVPDEIGRNALTSADRAVVDAATTSGAHLDQGGAEGDLLLLTRTGRTCAVLGGGPAPADAELLGSLKWPNGRPVELSEKHSAETARESALRDELHAWLRSETTEQLHRRIDRISYSLVHMAPVLIYVGDRYYSNLGPFSNLPGKSLSIADDSSELTRLKSTRLAEWTPEDACFVACLSILLRSGPPVRAEEFNGVQLAPDVLEEFLRTCLHRYRATPPARDGRALGPWLEELAGACAAARGEVLRAGATPYRVINGVTLHKTEHLLEPPLDPRDIPAAVRGFLATWTGSDVGSFDDLRAGVARLAAELDSAPAPDGFTTAYEAFLHELLTRIAEESGSDVAMGRGPRSFAPLRSAPGRDPFALRTNDFFCCVAASSRFAERFRDDRQGLVRCLSAYSARMRFNTWHYLPHTLGIAEGQSTRDDWFFAPTMPDVTQWSDQHHTGHVQFGVRYAIRVPVGITFDDRYLPGLYDLRLMRVGEPAFGMADLRAAVATGAVLGMVHQAMSAHDVEVRDFANDWYRTFHG